MDIQSENKAMIERINQLRKERNAVILAHNYQLGEVQEVAGFNGDSLELSIKANNTDADVIVFCGVKFMAETAHILSPEKTVLLPVMEAGCPMADMADAEGIRKMKEEHPGALVITYVNSTAEAKAESDICVTSANALGIVQNLPEDQEIIFVPDTNLGTYVQEQTKRKMYLWPGYCPTHLRITPEMVKRRKEEYPGALVLIHPESPLSALRLADEVLSTGGMCGFAKKSDAKQMIVATEMGLIHRLQKENPEKQFIHISEQATCPFMKLIRLPDIIYALENMEHVISMPEDIRVKAKIPIERMLEESKKIQRD